MRRHLTVAAAVVGLLAWAAVARGQQPLFESLTHDFGAALAAADLALARAGGSVYELAAAGTPAVLVPYPHATADHQTNQFRAVD